MHEEEVLRGMMRIASGITILFTACVFLLSLSSPQDPVFFANWIKCPINSSVLLIIISGVEACICAMAWVSNISITIQMPSFTLLMQFWASKLDNSKGSRNLHKKWNNRIEQLGNTWKMYRQLQVIQAHFNECFSLHVQTLFMLAFVNIICCNYGTVRLYGKIPAVAYTILPYLSVSGAYNICTVHNYLAKPYETSRKSIESWKNVDERFSKATTMQRRLKRRFVRSCASLRMKYGSLKYVTRNQGIEWLDSEIDATLSLLLWH